MADYRVISSDNHVFEPGDLWISRATAEFKDRVPRIERLDDGDWWFCDGVKVIGLGPGSQTGMRFEEQENIQRTTTVEDLRPGGWIPEEHMKDMDEDGVDVSIVYPTVGLLLYSMPDSDLLTEIFRTYNNWLADFCKPFPSRLKGIACINVDDVKSGVKELERCANMGLAGGMITVHPPEGQGYNQPEYEPLWAAAQDLRMPDFTSSTLIQAMPLRREGEVMADKIRLGIIGANIHRGWAPRSHLPARVASPEFS